MKDNMYRADVGEMCPERGEEEGGSEGDGMRVRGRAQVV